MEAHRSFTHLSNSDLAAEVLRLAGCERTTTAELIASLAEFDRRRLYLEFGFKSLFTYCFEVLHLSQHAAYGRIEAARAARKFPCVLRLIEEGRLTLTNLCLLSPHLTPANHRALLEEAAHKRKEDVQKIVARLAPKPDVPSLVRKIPVLSTRVPAASPVAMGRQAEPEPHAPLLSMSKHEPNPPAPAPKRATLTALSPERYKLQVTIDEDTRDVLKQAQDLMRHTLPTGDPAVIVARALRLLVDELLKKKAAITERPQASRAPADGARTIPAAVRRAVWKRDHGRCTFEGPRGRCDARSPLEFHHVIPYAMGGQPAVDNVELRCRAHNAYQARLDGLGWAAGTDPLEWRD